MFGNFILEISAISTTLLKNFKRDEHLRSMLEKFEYGTPLTTAISTTWLWDTLIPLCLWASCTLFESYSKCLIFKIEAEVQISWLLSNTVSYQYLNIRISEIYPYKDS